MIVDFIIFALAFNVTLIQADFAICTYDESQYCPESIYANSQFYTFWNDRRFVTEYCLYGARISESGTVIDPDGKELFRNQVDIDPAAAFDGTNFLVAFRDSC